ncbi:serine acetyltransferase [Marinitoga sp. 1197]|uniref:serine O-acetyltransferase EpsC n=1 Tax=Marinitoga sp. 1197 TaxID=1428449 RepID=UPI0006411C84|nr:serine O-acetyltransferase EpsC [Marinitoga sp. 1197]KLO20993.1 serine acetyltransferase [Marinitoga sp. 1197]
MKIIINAILDFLNIFIYLNQDLNEYLKKDPASKYKLGVILFNTAFHGLIFYRIYHYFYKYKIYPLSYFLYMISKILYSMDIHPAAKLEPGIVIDHGLGIVIGSTATVGKGTLIYHQVTLGAKHIKKGKRHPDIGENVIIGTGSKILGDISVGANSVIAANSVVLENIPSNCLVAGIPATIKTFEYNQDKIYEINHNFDFVI